MNRMWTSIKSPGFMAFFALASFAVAIYQGFFYEKRGNLVITMAPPAKVLDIHKAVGGLDVSYAGENLRSTKKTLWVISATLKNEGNAEIRKADYDENEPVGLSVKDGQIVDTPSIRTPIEYLQKNMKLFQQGNSVVISPAIIEPGDTAYISFVVLGSEDKKPSLLALGKVAGLPYIDLKNLEDEPTSGLMYSVFYMDRWWMQPLRALAYFFISLIAMTIVVSLFASISTAYDSFINRKSKITRRSSVEKYRHGETLSKEVRALTSVYIEAGDSSLVNLLEFFRTIKKRTILLDRLSSGTSTISKDEAFSIVEQSYPDHGWVKYELDLLKLNGVSTHEFAVPETVESWIDSIKLLADFLNINLKNHRGRGHRKGSADEKWDGI